MLRPKIPRRICRNWIIDKEKVFSSIYRYDSAKRIFKFCYQPKTGELFFDIAPTPHYVMILAYGKKRFEDYVRGICFWYKRTIYLRGHENEDWLKQARQMLRKQGISRKIRVIWGKKAACELREDLKGL